MNRSMALLKEMETVSPDLMTYSGVVSCISKSEGFDDARMAEDVLERMIISNDILPDNGES